MLGISVTFQMIDMNICSLAVTVLDNPVREQFCDHRKSGCTLFWEQGTIYVSIKNIKYGLLINILECLSEFSHTTFSFLLTFLFWIFLFFLNHFTNKEKSAVLYFLFAYCIWYVIYYLRYHKKKSWRLRL